MIRATFPALRTGAALTPQFAPYETAMGSEYYVVDIPANDVSPNTRAAVQGSGDQDDAGLSTLLSDHAPQHGSSYDRTAGKGESTAPALMPEARKR